MIEITEMRTPITPEQGLSILQESTEEFGCYFDLDCILEHISWHAQLLQKLLHEYRNFLGDPTVRIPAPAEKKALLTVKLGVATYKITDKHTGRLSAGSELLESLLKDTTEPDDVRKAAALFLAMSEHATARGHLNQFANLPLCKLETYDGHRMVRATPTWALLATNRFSSSSPNLQGVAKEHNDIYTAPKGYAAIFSDSGQIEPRITYSAYLKDDLLKRLIIAYNDAYYGILHYIRLTPEQEFSLRNDTAEIAPFPITPELEKERKTLKVLGLAGTYGSSNLSAVDPVLGPLYANKIVKHPARKELESTVRSQVARGVETFYTAFNNKITPESNANYTRGTPGWTEHVIRCGINNPIQGTAADLMLFSIFEVRKVLGIRGHIGYYKHDEGCFYVPEDKADDYAEKLRGCLSYAVKGRIPIHADLHVGRKEVDKTYATGLF